MQTPLLAQDLSSVVELHETQEQFMLLQALQDADVVPVHAAPMLITNREQKRIAKM